MNKSKRRKAKIIYFLACMALSFYIGEANEKSVSAKQGDAYIIDYKGEEAFATYEGELSAGRENILLFTMKTIGKVRYVFGDNAREIGLYDEDLSMDCSGYVSWILTTALKRDKAEMLLSTCNMTDEYELEEINEYELIPGDLGFFCNPGSIGNHVGIFVGYNSQGKKMWAHCSSVYKKSILSEAGGQFRKFYSIKNLADCDYTGASFNIHATEF